MIIKQMKQTTLYRKGKELERRIRKELKRYRERRRFRRKAIAALVANDTAMLEGMIYLLEDAQAQQTARKEGLEITHERLALVEQALQSVHERFLGQFADANRRFEERLTHLDGRLAEQLADTDRRFVQHFTDLDRRILGRMAVVETDRYGLLNPEVDLLLHLASHIPVRTAIDVGAHVGEISASLLDLGFEVHAFEPFPPVFEELRRRLDDRPGFRPHCVAVGAADGEMDLRLATDQSGGVYGDPTLLSSLLNHSMPRDLHFTSSVRVPVRSLESLHRTSEIPRDVGIVKIDAEGFDIEVIRGMGDHCYPVVVAEFWDREMEFGRAGALNRLNDLVAEMRRRDYPWHIVLYRVWGADGVAHYCNLADSVERSWGNVFFFRDRHLFSAAQSWCGAVLPVARFTAKPSSGAPKTEAAPVASAEILAQPK